MVGDYYDETNKRINRANAEVGGIVFPPGRWRTEIAPLADAFDNDSFSCSLRYDSDAVAKRIAQRVLRNHIQAASDSGRCVYEGWCPASEAALFALGPCYNPTYVVALRNIEQLRDVKNDMNGNWRCDTLVSRHCGVKTGGMNAEYPVEFLAVKRGEHVCVFTACLPCLDHIRTGKGVDHPDYIGPEKEWFDDRPADPIFDPWSDSKGTY